jgi:hypothetical protein
LMPVPRRAAWMARGFCAHGERAKRRYRKRVAIAYDHLPRTGTSGRQA